ncbi:hypothetical protein IFR05_016253 [Cadophora sp. M221]|nr:hypothetical protein IFR05_016253 [Cadophora sp. M221]
MARQKPIPIKDRKQLAISSRTSTLPKTTPRNLNQDIEVKVRDTAPVGGHQGEINSSPYGGTDPKNLASQVTAAKQQAKTT